MKFFRFFVILGLCFLPGLAAAHPGHYHPPGEIDEFDALMTGFLHPLTGLDHMFLAMAVGWLAFTWGSNNARWPVLAFLGSFLVGGVAGRGFVGGVWLEVALAFTLVFAGAGFLLQRRIPFRMFVIAVSGVGFVHGFAHGCEAAVNVPFGAYAGGVLLGTLELLGIGGLMYVAASKLPVATRVTGCALLVAGCVFLIQAI